MRHFCKNLIQKKKKIFSKIYAFINSNHNYIGILNYILLTYYKSRPHNFRVKFANSGHSAKEVEKRSNILRKNSQD